MVQLARNPIEGGSVIIRLTFKDTGGVLYEPVEDSVSYSLFALRTDNQWDIVKSDQPLKSGSVIDIILQGEDLALLPNCVTKRRMVIDWTYLRNGEETLGRDIVDFSITPLPVVAP